MASLDPKHRFVVGQVLNIDTGEPTGHFVLLEKIMTCDGPRTRISCEVHETFEQMQERVKGFS